MTESPIDFNKTAKLMTDLLAKQELRRWQEMMEINAKQNGFETAEEYRIHLKHWSSLKGRFLKMIGKGPKARPSLIKWRSNSVVFTRARQTPE